ncbi:tyrosine-type recombinase/integrase [Azotobacter beijerinckii]|uniref:Site-specific recombinase XerD n=1 Tax=Azotobacter beijerinckii TaxID=170623 RepID=A0A1I3ZGD7_9GAMM|nr:tyrosine-type recombinase/integrase [Azotobacter beijerinckii]SFB32355.1 Site-specific recombinase XerD [Azotobacter beijerinckii]SFK43103.1 Site-specific recombinase XerD [Azotobacter beijerinckii]
MTELVPQPLFDTYARFLALSANSLTFENRFVVRFLNKLEPGLPAKNDYLHTRDFLRSYAGWETTYKAYRIQVERLLLWSWLRKGSSILKLTRQDAETFLEFTREPDMAWVGQAVRRRFIAGEEPGELVPNPQWRPYEILGSKAARKLADETGMPRQAPEHYSLTSGSLKQTFAICSSFYDFLNTQDALIGNPFRAIPEPGRFFEKRAPSTEDKVLEPLQWAFVIETAEWMAHQDPERHERTLFVVAMLFSLYLRISELAGRPDWHPSMQAFQQDAGGAWWYVTVGKGGKERRISVSRELLGYLKRYRMSRNLMPLPQPGESTPLLLKLDGRGGLTDRQIRNIVQKCFDTAVKRMHAEGRSEKEISGLRAASAYWLRHTSATYDAPHRPLKHLQDDLGHAKASTTQDIYYSGIEPEHTASGRSRRLKNR